MIRILKASAGSGKTFQLARTYIRELFTAQDPHPWRHILAVTFTNKATDEMKSRILKELDILARIPEQSGYIREFRRDFGPDETIRQKAAFLLEGILQDYGAFAVSTIDRFFQQALKSFAREIGQFASYQVELDKPSLVHESVDRILDGLTEADRSLLRWLTDSVMEQLQEDGRMRLEGRLYEMADRLESEEFTTLAEREGIDPVQVFSKENLSRMRSACLRTRRAFQTAVVQAAQGVVSAFSEAGIPFPSTYRKFLCVIPERYAVLQADDPVPPLTEAFVRRAVDPGQWFPKGESVRYGSLAEGAPAAAVRAFLTLFETQYPVYETAGMIRRHLYDLGIAAELFKAFDALQKEKNVLSLDDSNAVLRKIIDGCDAPFVYEKLGVRYEHFLLDEFQDTSAVQWENFKPLLKESDANGNANLIVGDVKQSIYRWRGSDWNLLGSQVKAAFPDADDSHPLDENWRSLGTIVRFNNAFFRYASRELARQCGPDSGLDVLYADVEQAVRCPDPAPGSVEVTFCPADAMLEEVLASIRKALSAGARPGQVAILVRLRDTGSAIASFLTERGVPVISDDSLRIKSSVTVRRLVSLLSYTDNPEDGVNGYLARSLGRVTEGRALSLPDLCEQIIRLLRKDDAALVEGETLYLQSFMDELQDWTSVNGNSLHAFLQYWEDADPRISSPDDPASVRILTIHKAKGLEFPYVIFPFAERVGLFRSDKARWARPHAEGTSLEGQVEGVFPVPLSAASEQTLFAEDYRQEKRSQYIDNLNTFYVALTRPCKGLHILASLPKTRRPQKEDPPFSNMAEVLHRFLREEAGPALGLSAAPCGEGEEREVFTAGVFYDYSRLSADGPRRKTLQAGYPSYPLDSGETADPGADVRERGRLKFASEAVDFFSEDGETGLQASRRLRGTVLHRILSEVVVPADLDGAVDRARQAGDLDADGAAEVRSALSRAIASVAAYGWFPADGARVQNEASVIGTDGRIWRPDRVVSLPDRTVIIDYKFGTHDPDDPAARAQCNGYRAQVGRYVSLYRAMGYPAVSGAIWYVDDGRVVPVA